MRNYRKELPRWLRLRRRTEQKKQALEQNYVERYLDDKYQEINLKVVRKNCAKFDPKNELCRSCRFYSQRIHEEKFGRTCPTWLTAFGFHLKAMIIDKTVKEGILLQPSFVEIWNARKAAIQDTNRGIIVHPNPAINRRLKAAQARSMSEIPIVIMGG